MRISPKNLLVGGLLNLLIPGLGNGYVGHWGRAAWQCVSSVVLLVALLFMAALLERTEPPWPEGLAFSVALLSYAVVAVIGGVVPVRRHNRALSTTTASQSANQVFPALLSVGIMFICLVLLLTTGLGGLFPRESWEPAFATRFPELGGTGTVFQGLSTGSGSPSTSPAYAVTQAPENTSTARTKAAETEITPPPTSTSAAAEPVAVVNHETLNVRNGPGTAYERTTVLQQGAQVRVTGRNTAGSWFQIILDDGSEGWIYADYTDLNTHKGSIPVVEKIPPLPTASQPVATLTVDEQIAKIAKGQHGTLPQPGSTGHAEAGGLAEVTVINDTPYALTVLVGAPSSTSFHLDACGSCRRYVLVGPAACPEEGRPRLTVRLQPGNAEVVARVNDSSVAPFYGRWDLDSNTAYFNCFFIVTRSQ